MSLGGEAALRKVEQQLSLHGASNVSGSSIAVTGLESLAREWREKVAGMVQETYEMTGKSSAEMPRDTLGPRR
eukprot:CAMPEP_0179300650 /NCGR_PEP_ID=MMETSP0797-20121207/47148_1 /TAXON_ID=47934 /ORGANISM="Dinophysis acuminata, Strain DAEP01" /LENGTH=72 /DNA_ID=CAMNT_0021010135 /DNA_START=105 /DNA_END=323 /DNA_ORIENTATION=-